MTQTQYIFKRYEKKYFLTPAQLAALQNGMLPYMKADRFAQSTICNIYYDTEQWDLIRASLEKPVYKEKLRIRSYGIPQDGDTVYTELKKKYKGVVYKRRFAAQACTAPEFLRYGSDIAPVSQIEREVRWFQELHRTEPRVFIAYDREAYADIADSGLRITFDCNIRWRMTDLDLRLGDAGAPVLSTDDILMEIKFPAACPLWLSGLLSEIGAFPTTFSKYGTCYSQFILNRKTEPISKEAQISA